MIAKFQFLLDKQYVDDPKNWDDLDTTIKRDQAISGLLIAQESQLEFYGNGYDYIKQQFDTQGFCSFIEIEIRQTCDQLNYEPIFNGIIYLSDCIFDLMRCSVKVKTVDDGFYARINNNKSIKAKLDVGRSKNDVTITAPVARAVQFFDPVNGVYDATAGHQPNVYTVFEVFKFLVAFMSDGRVDFISTDFDIGGQWEGQTVTIGNEVSLWDQSVIPELSFQDVFTEINKKNMIAFSIEKLNGKPTLRIENAEYFFGQTSAITLSDAKEVTMQLDTTQLYSQIHLGSTITDDAIPNVGQFPEAIRFLGFKDETFHIIGTCNVDRTLELNSQWIISSNIIEDIFVNGNNAYDSDIILVDVDLNTNKAVQSNWLGLGTSFYYNEVFNNKNTVQRWLKGIPNSIAFYLGNADNTCWAQITYTKYFSIMGSVITENPLRFDNDYTLPGYDTNNNWGNGTIQGNPVSQANSRYTAPQNGLYVFEVAVNFTQVTYYPSGFHIDHDVLLTLRRFDSGNVLIQPFFYQIFLNSLSTKNQTIKATLQVNLNTGDYIVPEIRFGNMVLGDYSDITIVGGYFKCSATEDGGGVYQTIDPADYKIKKYSFKYPITFQDLKTIKADTKKLITFTTNNGVQQTGWIDNIKYYHHNKPAEIVLISN